MLAFVTVLFKSSVLSIVCVVSLFFASVFGILSYDWISKAITNADHFNYKHKFFLLGLVELIIGPIFTVSLLAVSVFCFRKLVQKFKGDGDNSDDF